MGQTFVLGLAKDCEKTIERNIIEIDKFLHNSEKYWIVLESNSTDRTRSILDRVANQFSNFFLLNDPPGVDRFETRTEQMAARRQAVVDFAREMETRNDGVAVVVDFDNPLGINGEFSSIREQVIQGNAILPTQRAAYYDVLALRDQSCETDYRLRVDHRLRAGENIFRVYKEELFDIQRKVSRGVFPLEVRSGFGGIALYPLQQYLECEYSPSWECEHVSLSEQLRSKGVVLTISESLRTRRVREHTRFSSGVLYFIISLLAIWPGPQLNFLAGRDPRIS